jgi:hypothetical protein
MTMRIPRWLFAGIALFGLCAAMSLSQEATIRSTPPELESFLAMPLEDFDAKLSSSCWRTFYSAYVDLETVKAGCEKLGPNQRVHVHECVETAKAQQQTARDYAPYADVYSYFAFVRTSADKPPEDELLWGGLDNPFINHLRQMRKLVGTTPIVAILVSNIGISLLGDGTGRPAVLEEIQWQFIAAAGCGYRGVLWPVSYSDIAMGDDLKRIEEQVKPYGRFVAQAQPVNWAKAAEGQPISSLACNDCLFVFLLNPAYMEFDVDGKTVAAPLERPLCEGAVTLALPEGLKVRRCQTLLGGNTLRLASEDGKTTVQFSFKTGGEMMILALSGRAGLAAAAQPTAKPTAAQPANVEDRQ